MTRIVQFARPFEYDVCCLSEYIRDWYEAYIDRSNGHEIRR